MGISKQDIQRVKLMGFLHNRGTENFNCRVITGNGTLSAEQLQAVGRIAEKYGDGKCMFTTRMTVEFSGVPYDSIDAVVKELADVVLTTGGTGARVRPVTACKGTTCVFGFYDTQALGQKIHDRFYVGMGSVRLPHKFKIATGGCPNNCVKPDLNDLGIVGQLVPNVDEDMCNGCKKCQVESSCPMGAAKLNDGIIEINKEICNNCGRCIEKCPFDVIEDGTCGYRIYIGGRWGKKVAHGKPLSKIFMSEEELLDTVEKAILFFREQGNTGERFADTIARIGFEEVEKQLLADDILERKQEILDAKLHLVGGATC